MSRTSRLPCSTRWASRLLTSRVCVMPVRLPQDTDLQQFIDLVASPDDPKDLYSLVNVNVPVG